MNRCFNFLVMVASACFACIAQQALWSGADLKSPEIMPDRTVTFRLYAPEADTVTVTGDFLFERLSSNESLYIGQMETA